MSISAEKSSTSSTNRMAKMFPLNAVIFYPARRSLTLHVILESRARARTSVCALARHTGVELILGSKVLRALY